MISPIARTNFSNIETSSSILRPDIDKPNPPPENRTPSTSTITCNKMKIVTHVKKSLISEGTGIDPVVGRGSWQPVPRAATFR